MADTLVEDVVYSLGLDNVNGLWGPYWSDESTAVIVFVGDGTDMYYTRTTNKGASWTPTRIVEGTSRAHTACSYDKETPGNSGTLIHIAWLDSDDEAAYYITLDVADGSLGTRRTVDNTLTVSAAGGQNRIAITQTVSGNIIYALSTQTEIACYKSSDNFATAGTAIADVYETPTEEDWCLGFPAATADDNDAAFVFWDRSANELSLKMYDDSGDSWTETGIAGSMQDDPIHMNMDGSVRHSDSHVLFAAHSNDDNASDDLMTWDLTVDSIAAPTVSAKTDVFTNQGESAQVSVWINQQTDEVRIAYLKGGTWLATVDVVYHISVDGMDTWGAEQAYSEDGPADFRLVQAGRTVGDDGGRYQPSFFQDDDVDIYVNEVNDTEIAAVVPAVGVLSVQLTQNVIRIPDRMVLT